MKRWLGLCSLFALAALIPRGLAAGEAGATPKERADAVKWASEEPGQAAKRFPPGVDYPAAVRRCLRRDQRSFRYLFALSMHTDAAASELQAAILAVVLKLTAR